MTNTLTDLFIGQIARSQRTFTDEDVKACKDLTNDDSLYTTQVKTSGKRITINQLFQAY